MTPEKIQLYEIRDIIAALPDDERLLIESIAATLRNITRSNAQAVIAFSLVGAEMAAAP